MAAVGPGFPGAVPGRCELLSQRVGAPRAQPRVSAAAAHSCFPGLRGPGHVLGRRFQDWEPLPAPGTRRNTRTISVPGTFRRSGALQPRRGPCVLKELCGTGGSGAIGCSAGGPSGVVRRASDPPILATRYPSGKLPTLLFHPLYSLTSRLPRPSAPLHFPFFPSGSP